LKTTRHTRRTCPASPRLHGQSHLGAAKARKLVQLRTRLVEAEETLRAIRVGDVDTVMIAGKQGPQVFTLEGAGHAYRLLIESMNEGALTLTAKGVILYANQCFARMIKHPLEHVLGSSFHHVLSTADQAVLRPLLKRTARAGFKIQAFLHAGNGSQLPVQISIHPLTGKGAAGRTFGLVVTDMTEARRNEELLRALSHRLVQVQEAERGRVALELHDHITQLLCAILVRCQVLAAKLSTCDGSANGELLKLRTMLGQTAEEVERISRNLRPSVLEELGLVAVLRDTSTAFAERTGVSLKLTCAPLTARLSADVELALYRILQEALTNVERHARARHVAVCLRQEAGGVLLAVQDDGIGFNPEHYPAGRKGKDGLGLLGMRERATYVGGVLTVKAARRAGTAIEVRIPLSPCAAAMNGADV
jgi:two-component system NarL family sensor kinase